MLNNPRYSSRQILLTRDNFGNGSSREHAVWALLDYGFKAITAPSFADIFYNNCLKNGILPVRLPDYEVEYLFSDEDFYIEIDLARQTVIAGSHNMHFEIDNFHKKLLFEGLDSVGLTLCLKTIFQGMKDTSRCLLCIATKKIFILNSLRGRRR